MNMMSSSFAMLMLSVSAQIGAVHAEELNISCKLKGGTVVQMPVEACNTEGGMQVGATGSIADDPTLTAAQKQILEILVKPVEYLTPMNRNPEGIGRKPRFEGCKLMVDEVLHIEYGNFFSVWKDFKIHSMIDFQKISPSAFGLMGTVISKGGKLKGEAVLVEESTKREVSSISISVENLRDDKYQKYTIHGPSPYFVTPGPDLWIEDGYGYTKDNGMDSSDTSKVRLMYMVKTEDEAKNLKSAFEEVSMNCKMKESQLTK